MNSNYEKRNNPSRKFERIILKIMIFFIIPASLIYWILFPTPKITNTIPILLSLTGLIQLEISGLFEYISDFSKQLEESYNESGRIPSHLTRAIYEYYNPEPTLKACINNNLYLNKRIGFYLILLATLFQLFVIWFVSASGKADVVLLTGCLD